MILETLKTNPEYLHFSDVIEFIDEHYEFTPTAFKNGNTFNDENQNNGSCKIFGVTKLNQLSKEETLALFGDFYRTKVLGNPDGEAHRNFRNFMQFGWDGIAFSGEALKEKG